MWYLVAVVLLNTLLSVLFKLFPRFKIDALQAIVVNYWVCVVTGSVYLGHMPIKSASVHTEWFPWALMAGVLLISLFNLLAYSTKVEGITTTTIANKLSLVIPVLFSIVLYHDTVNFGKILGIVLAFPAVYLTARVKEENNKVHHFLWPILIFLGSGLLDTLMKYVQQNHLPDAHVQAVFTIFAFAIAGSLGALVILLQLATGKTKLSMRNVVAGIGVGIPNYFSIYWFVRMLNSNFLQSSATIPINNIGIVVVSTLTAVLLFREKVTTLRIIGLILAIIAILLIAFNGRTI